MTALTLALSAERISIAGPSPSAAASALSRLAADEAVMIGRGTERPARTEPRFSLAALRNELMMIEERLPQRAGFGLHDPLR